MTDREYLEEMIHLTTKLSDACNNFGLRSDEYKAVIKEIAASAACFNRSRRQNYRFFTYLLWFILGMFAWVILTGYC